jgi:dUTP pyrophosphatase
MSDVSPVVIFHPLHADAALPTRATSGSAGYDVRVHLRERTVLVADADGLLTERSAESTDDGVIRLRLRSRETALVPLGFRARLPHGFEAQLRLRSSSAFRKGLTMPNAPGTIDSDYPDEWMVMLRNDRDADVLLEHGERIAQVVLHRCESVEWSAGEVGVTTDRTGGIGSTGH